MAKDETTANRTDVNPAHQTGEEKGPIKRPQQTGEKDVPRGSEAETHARK